MQFTKFIFALSLSLAFTTYSKNSQPNIILILADDMGYGDVGFNGSKKAMTPNIDKIAAQGVAFEQGYAAASVCGPSRAGLLTGRHQQEFGVFGNPETDRGLPHSQPMIGQLMKRAGYTTGALGKWHMGSSEGYFPNDKGFDFFYGFHYGAHDYYRADAKPVGKKKSYAPIWRNKEMENYKEGDYLTNRISEEAVSFIKRNTAKPFFLYVAYNSVHSPWQAPQEYLDRIKDAPTEYRKLFKAMVLAMDDGIGQITKTLENEGLDDNTVIIFMTDNGSPKIGNKKPNTGDERMSETLGYRGYKGDTYEGGIRVPFCIKWPGKIKAGQKYAHPVSALDIVPTLCSHIGIEAPEAKFSGKNLLPYLQGEHTDRPHELMFWYRIGGESDHAVRLGDWKLTWNDQEGATKDFLPADQIRYKLFNLKEDKYEKNDLAAAMPEVVSKLQDQFKDWKNSLPQPQQKASTKEKRKHKKKAKK